jgi:hypothetical protein
MKMRKRTHDGQAKNFPLRQSGSLQREVGWMAPHSAGGMSIFLMAKQWPTHGRANFPGKTFFSTGSRGRHQWAPSPPNGYGLYDMAGNVWEWTADRFVPRHGEGLVKSCCGPPANPRILSPEESYDPAQPELQIPRKVVKGGSFLCAPNYCLRYRPAARQPQMVDTGMSHIGFRCVIRKLT